MEGEILGLPPDQFARWVAYFRLRQKDEAKARKAAQKKGAPPQGRPGAAFRGR